MSAQYNSEYSGNAVASSKCSYNTLCNYYGPRSTMPVVRSGSYSGVMVTPTWGGIGYDALTHGTSGSCQQYFNINNAYGSGAGNCSTSYTSRLCGGGCGQQPGQKYQIARGSSGIVACYPSGDGRGHSLSECNAKLRAMGPQGANTGVYDSVPQSNMAL